MSLKIKPHKIFEIYQEARGKRIFTKSILPGAVHFEERIVKEKGNEYREFDARRSKLAAMIMKGCTNAGIREGDVILYLGISHGYTASFVSDMIGKEGLIFGLDHAPRVVRDLVFLAEKRNNIVPLLANANHTDEYVDKVSAVDIVYQDISQKNQAEIFINNCNLFLKKGGYGLLAVKARSIDIKRRPKEIFVSIRKQLEKIFTVIDYKVLEPFQKDHAFIIIKKN
tara:strand:+ start:664 stop:1341 length:678 start_codon:yes stop_codon:yes gene_type:complete